MTDDARSDGHSEQDLAQFGWGPRWDALAAEGIAAGLAPGVVVRHDGSAVLVATGSEVAHAALVGSTPPMAVGDRVLVGDGVVRDVLHRTSLLQRRDPSTGEGQPIAANVDVVVVVCGLDRPIRSGRIERFVTLAWDAGAVPLVVCTKGDLAEPEALAEATEAAEAAAPGTSVLVVSALDGDGLDELRSELADRTAVFVGESGAGKSTLLNALAGVDLAATGGVRAGDAKGRHTTTARQLHVLDGFRVIDTPGVREVGLWAGIDAVDATFDDVVELAADCRFGDCAHDGEPGCAVVAAVAEGRLPAARLESWHHLRKEAAAAELRADPVAARRAGKRFGRLVREAQRLKPRD
ncbi:MAG: ribosome small subunit-dependent GTPase A [Acidimicrobiales bacterium]